VVHNRDRLEKFQNSLIEHTPKAAFLALDLSIKQFRPFPSDLKTDQELKVIFEIPKFSTSFFFFCSQKVDISTTNI